MENGHTTNGNGEAPQGNAPAHPGRWLRRLGREEFARLMGASIEGALSAHVGASDARRLRWDALRRFSSLLAARTRPVRALTRSECLAELEATHGKLLRERAQQADELARIEQELVVARGAEQASVLTEAEQETLERELAADLTALIASPEPRKGIERVVTRESARRTRALAVVVARERERIDQLERRLAKLRLAQEQTERDLVELARRAELDTGIPSIYRMVQGLSASEAEREAKALMLAQIFEQNVLLQNRSA